MTYELNVRTATDADAQTIAALLKEVYAPYSDRFRPTALRWMPGDVAALVEAWLVAETDGQLAGVVHHGREGAGLYTFDALAVTPRSRRSGIGSALLERVERQAERAEARGLIIALRRSLAENIAFFSARGYRYSRRESSEHDVYTKQLPEVSRC